MDDKKQILEKQLNYITSNFELDLLRLIKTRSYISMSKEVIDEELNSIKQLTLNFQEKLKSHVMKTVEFEREFVNDSSSNGLKNQEYFRNLKNNLNDYIASTESYISDLESRHVISKEKLDSLQRYYLMELEASREELDFRIKSLQGNMSKMFEGEEIEVKNYHDQIVKKHSDIEKEIETKVLENKLTREEEAKGEFDSVLKATETSERIYGNIKNDISATTEIRKYRKNKRERWQQIFGIIFISGIISICITLFYFYNKDYKEIQLAEQSYKQSKVDNPIDDKAESSAVLNNEIENVEEVQDEVVPNTSPDLSLDDNILEQVNNKDPEKTESSKIGDSDKVKNQELPSEPIKKFTLIGKAANVRSGPSTRYGVVTVVKRGDIFESLNENSRHWMKIKLSDQKEGWISGRLIKEVPQ